MFSYLRQSRQPIGTDVELLAWVQYKNDGMERLAWMITRWEGALDTSVACKGDPLLHQMLCVPAQVQYWHSQFHVGDVVLARYWGAPMYYRGILVKILEDLSVNVMFESGHLQRNVPCSHVRWV